jgi:hypothetical protein
MAALGGLHNFSFVVQKPEPLGKLMLIKLFYLTTNYFKSNDNFINFRY